MNDLLLEKYVNKLTKDHIINYAKNNEIIVSNNEVDIIYDYIKKYWRKFYYENPKDLFDELKSKLSPNTYNKLIQIYTEAKEKIKK